MGCRAGACRSGFFRVSELEVGQDRVGAVAMGGGEGGDWNFSACFQRMVLVSTAFGIAHAGVKNIGAGHILEFRDPDNVALELFAPA